MQLHLALELARRGRDQHRLDAVVQLAGEDVVRIGYVLQDGMKEATTMLAPLSALLIVEMAGALAAYGAIKHARRRKVPARSAHGRAPVEDPVANRAPEGWS